MIDPPSYRMVDISRRGYGRRYTMLIVDDLSKQGFRIDLHGAYMRPERYDIRSGDVVHWRDGERIIQAVVEHVSVGAEELTVVLRDAQPIPIELYEP